MRLTLRGALAAAFVLGMCAVCVRLGFWQLDRLEQRRARNAALSTALRMPALDFDSATAAAIERQPELFLNRRVRLAGTYAPEGQVILRGRSHQGNPGVHLVTPLVVPGVPQAVLVNRGFAPSPDAATVDPRPYAEPGPRTVEGVFQKIPVTEDGGAPSTSRAGGVPTLTFRRLDLNTLRQRSPRPLVPLYVQQLPGPDSAIARPPYRVPLPPLGNGPHLSYAVQWFSFAAIGVIGLVVIVLRRRKQAGA